MSLRAVAITASQYDQLRGTLVAIKEAINSLNQPIMDLEGNGGITGTEGHLTDILHRVALGLEKGSHILYGIQRKD